MADKLVKCRILRDFWDNDGLRHRAGKVVDVPSEAAMDGLEDGVLERVKADKKAAK